MRKTIATDAAPQAIGPYSQAVQTSGGTTIYCSGQIALDPASGELVGDSAGQQCRQVLTNLKAVLKAAGSCLGNVVKTTLYLADMTDFAAVNEVYGTFFTADPPARAAVAVRDIPKGAKLMIDAVAVVA